MATLKSPLKYKNIFQGNGDYSVGNIGHVSFDIIYLLSLEKSPEATSQASKIR